MPMIRVDLIEGRTPEQHRQLIKRLSEVTAEVLDTPIERVRVCVNEVPPTHWGIGGVSISELRPAQVR